MLVRKSEFRNRALPVGARGKSARLSAGRGGWQSAPSVRGVVAVLLPVLLAALLPFAFVAPAAAASGGPIGTLPIGRYLCETPGSADIGPGVHQPAEDFAIVHGSRYALDGGDKAGRTGLYLLTGDLVQMTSGPARGARYHRISENLLRKLGPGDVETSLRCIRAVPNNGGWQAN